MIECDPWIMAQIADDGTALLFAGNHQARANLPETVLLYEMDARGLPTGARKIENWRELVAAVNQMPSFKEHFVAGDRLVSSDLKSSASYTDKGFEVDSDR